MATSCARLLGLAAAFLLMGTCAAADGKAVILVYHNVAEDTLDSTSVTPAAFGRHLQYLEDNDFRVWPLQEILVHLDADKPIRIALDKPSGANRKPGPLS